MSTALKIRRLLLPILFTVCTMNSISAWSAEALDRTAPTVLITGSNRGIGLELTRQYAQRDWNVIATCRHPGEADDLKKIAQKHANVQIERMDITDQPGIDAVVTKYAGTGIDVLINNAALLGSRNDQALGNLDFDLFQQILAVNTMGTMKVTEAFLDNVAISDQKKIITLGSAAGSIQMIRPPADFYAYRASKAALHLLMRNLALDLADRGILVGLLNPGLVDTRGFAKIGPDDPVPDDFKKIMELIRGGALELITPEESVGQLIPLIDGLTPEQSGVFINYDGQVMPW